MDILYLIKRNMKRYFREPSTVFFSFLSVFIVLALYVLFLSNSQSKTITNMLGETLDLTEIINYWVLGGIITIPALSVPLIILCFKVDDVVNKIQDDFLVSPSKRHVIVLGYVLASWILGFFMTMLTFALGYTYIVIQGGTILPFSSILKITLIIGLTILSFSGFLYFIIGFMKSKSSPMILNSILNTLIGFFAILYIPLGELSKSVAIIIKAFPLAQITSLIRQIMLNDVLNDTFATLPPEYVNEFRIHYGIDLYINNQPISQTTTVTILIIFAFIFYTGSIINLYKTKRK